MHGDIQGRLAETQRLAAEATAEAVSENGEVRVVAGPGGEVKLIDLRIHAFELSGFEIGELTAATIKVAAAKADQALAASIRGLLGGFFEAERQEP